MKQFIRGHENKSLQPINIPAVEDRFNGKFIGDFCIKTNNGSWSEEPLAVFYNDNPDVEKGHSNYFAIGVAGSDKVFITRGDSAFDDLITGIVADDGEVIFSRYRHDFVTSYDDSVWIDGGRDYCRFGGDPDRLVSITVLDGELVIL